MDKESRLALVQRSLGIRHKLKVQESMKPPETHEDLAVSLMAKWDYEDELQAIEDKRPVVLVAYSLGALVTYGVLDDAKTSRESPVALVTLGSPLGDDDIRALLGSTPDSLRVPPNVAHWENVYDPGDVFASPIADIVKGAKDVELSTRGVDAVEAHHVNRYLTDRVTGEALARALCAVSHGSCPRQR